MNENSIIKKISPDRIVSISVEIVLELDNDFASYQYEDDLHTITEIRHRDLVISLKTLEEKDNG